MCCQFMKATLRGDLAEFESCLAGMLNSNGGFTSLCKHFGETFVTAAAECGHLHIVNAILDRWGKKLVSPVVSRPRNIAQDLLWVAFRDGHFELAVRVLLEGDISRYPKMGSERRFVRPEVLMCPAEFFRNVLRVIVERFDKTRQKINDEWFKRVLVEAITFRSRRHMETLLDEVDPSRLRRSVNFIDHPDLMEAVLRSRSASILRCVLIRYPEVAIDNAECDPAVVIKKYHWPAGARLTVEAGVKCKGSMPPEHAGILTLPSAHVRRQSLPVWPPTLNKTPSPFTFTVPGRKVSDCRPSEYQEPTVRKCQQAASSRKSQAPLSLRMAMIIHPK